MKTFITAGLLIFTFMLAGVVSAAEPITLPDPNTIILDSEGNPIPLPDASGNEVLASQHDDFFGYSAVLNYELYLAYEKDKGPDGTKPNELLEAYKTYDVYNPVHLGDAADLIIYTQKVTDNPGVFPDSLEAPNEGAGTLYYTGAWGTSDAPVLVDDLMAYLQTNYEGSTIPAFLFNMNQEGDSPANNIFMAGRVSIWDPLGGIEVAAWEFDNMPGPSTPTVPTVLAPDDGTYPDPSTDPYYTQFMDGTWVPAIGDLTLPFGLEPNDKDVIYYANHNLGNGAMDFIGIAPTMDLSLYDGMGYQFRTRFYLASMNDGFETLTLTGAYAPYSNGVVPEPASMALVGLGLFGLGVARRKKK